MKPVRTVGIATALAVVFGGLVALSAGTLLVISLTSAVQTTRDALTAQVNRLLDEALALAESFYRPMETQARWLAEEINAGHVRPADNALFHAVLYGSLAHSEQIAAVSYQRPDGTGLFYDRELDGLHSVVWPPAWQVALNTRADGTQTWPPATGQWVLRPSVLDGVATGTFIVPVRAADGQDTGVVGVRRDHVPLARAFAENATFRGYELVRFMLFDGDIVVAHPELEAKSRSVRLSIDDLDDPFLKAIETAPRQPMALLNAIDRGNVFRVDTEAGPRVIVLRKLDDYTADGEILIGVHFDPATGGAEINRIVTQATVGAGLLIGTILLAIIIGRRAALPVRRLATAAEFVQAERLDDVVSLPTSPVRELATASSAFNGMVEGLKERKRIRDLFGKYVPEGVAALLMSDDRAAAPRNAMATVMFLDIAGFSAMSERLSPAELVDTMNAFFSDAVHAIERHGGMVAQFQGDALLAVFNVPFPQANHASAAVRAACAVLHAADEQRYGGERLECRIGINTGIVVAGAIGARERLSYTVYGDTVNVASRLEALNKELATRLLVAGSTADCVHDVVFQPCGEITVRGRSTPVSVYSVTNVCPEI